MSQNRQREDNTNRGACIFLYMKPERSISRENMFFGVLPGLNRPRSAACATRIRGGLLVFPDSGAPLLCFCCCCCCCSSPLHQPIKLHYAAESRIVGYQGQPGHYFNSAPSPCPHHFNTHTHTLAHTAWQLVTQGLLLY